MESNYLLNILNILTVAPWEFAEDESRYETRVETIYSTYSETWGYRHNQEAKMRWWNT